MKQIIRTIFLLIVCISFGAQNVFAVERHKNVVHKKHDVVAVDAERVLAEAADPLLDDHLKYFRGERLLKEGSYDKALNEFNAIVSNYPDSIWATEARLGLARALIGDGNFDEGMKMAEACLRGSPNKYDAFDARLFVGRALMGLGEARAVDQFKNLVFSADGEAQLKEATDFFAELDRKFGAGMEAWFNDPFVQYRIAQNFFNGSQWDQAAVRLRDNVLKSRGVDSIRRDAELLYAKALARTHRYDEAIEIFEKLKKEGTDDNDFLFWLARTYAKANRFDDAIRVRREMIRRHPDPSIAAKIAFIMVDQGKYAEAIDEWRGVLAMKPHGETLSDADWYIAWCNLRLGRSSEAAALFDSLAKGGRRSAGSDRAKYWRARALIDAGNAAEGKALLRELSGKSGYYGMLAARRLNGDRRTYATFADLGNKGARSYSGPRLSGLVGGGSVHIAKALKLDSLGLHNLAALEMYSTDRGRRGGISDGAYRAVYAPYISKFIAGSGLNERLVLAIMRIESNFRPDVVSPAGAIGLLQMMPSTARNVDPGDGGSQFDSRRLFDPAVNIEIGVGYLKKLMDMFPRDYVSVIASYNAGEEAVGRWIKMKQKLHDDDIEMFIEEIPYDETNLYVKKVLSNYWAL